MNKREWITVIVFVVGLLIMNIACFDVVSVFCLFINNLFDLHLKKFILLLFLLGLS